MFVLKTLLRLPFFVEGFLIFCGLFFIYYLFILFSCSFCMHYSLRSRLMYTAWQWRISDILVSNIQDVLVSRIMTLTNLSSFLYSLSFSLGYLLQYLLLDSVVLFPYTGGPFKQVGLSVYYSLCIQLKASCSILHSRYIGSTAFTLILILSPFNSLSLLSILVRFCRFRPLTHSIFTQQKKINRKIEIGV